MRERQPTNSANASGASQLVLRIAGMHCAEEVSAIRQETGERSGVRAVAEAIGVDEVRAELLPEQKVAAVEELVARYGAVAVVRDGVNDTPAVARSTLAIAIGAAGTDAALGTADVALMSDDLSRLPWLIRHSRRALAIIRQNIIAAPAVKAVFVVLSESVDSDRGRDGDVATGRSQCAAAALRHGPTSPDHRTFTVGEHNESPTCTNDGRHPSIDRSRGGRDPGDGADNCATGRQGAALTPAPRRRRPFGI